MKSRPIRRSANTWNAKAAMATMPYDHAGHGSRIDRWIFVTRFSPRDGRKARDDTDPGSPHRLDTSCSVLALAWTTVCSPRTAAYARQDDRALSGNILQLIRVWL